MKLTCFCCLAVLLGLAGYGGSSSFTQTDKPEKLTARRYYEELKAAGGVNRFANLVCFRSDDSEIFDLLSFR